MRKREKLPTSPRFLTSLMGDKDAVLRYKAGRADWWLKWEKGYAITSALSEFEVPVGSTSNDMW